MSDAVHRTSLAVGLGHRIPARPVLAVAVLGGAALGFLITTDAASSHAMAEAGPELTRLLRAMAAIKVVFAAALIWLIDWRLRFPISVRMTASYVAAVAIMAVGPGLIWSMAHVGVGALLLHGGAAALIVLFWRDPGSPAMTPSIMRRSPT